MPVRFLIGRAGSGKTRRCVEEIARACVDDPLGAPIVYLVPEQSSYEAEKALLTAGILDGYTRAQVLSFTRLADYVFARTPAPDRPRLTPTHREVLTALLVARERREHPGSFVATPGMEDALADFVSETKQYALDLARLREAAALVAAEKLKPSRGSARLLADKLQRLIALLEMYDNAIGSRFEDPQDTLLTLADIIQRSDLFQGADIYLDGFIGFTPVEERLVVALARKARQLTIALPGDRTTLPPDGRRHPIFGAVEETFERLQRAFQQNGIGNVTTQLLEGVHRTEVESLRFLEAAFWSRGGKTCGNFAGVEFEEAGSIMEEARLAAETVAQLLRGNNWRPGDVAILTRDLETYAAPIEEALTTLKIPHFLDRAEPLQTHPFVVGIQSLVRAALQPGTTDHLIELGKSGLLDIQRADVDQLQIHVTQHPRSPREWYSNTPWPEPPSRSPADEDEPGAETDEALPRPVDECRRHIVSVVREFAADFQKGSRDKGLLRDFLLALCNTINDLLKGREIDPQDEQILERLGALFGVAAEAAGAEIVTWELAGDLAIRSLAQLSLPRIPPLLDQVFVGQVDRSRYPRLMAVVVLGLSEGLFPKVAGNRSLLNDEEREALEEFGIDIRPSSRRQFEREALFAYRAFAAPSHYLKLMRSRADDTGTELVPSPYWLEARRMFPNAPLPRGGERYHPARCWRQREYTASVLRLVDEAHLRPIAISSESQSLLAASSDSQLAAEDRAVRDAAKWRNDARLSPESVRAFLNGRLAASPSRLESFARCPFQHFVRYMLRPRELALPEFERTDAGMYAHAVLRNFTRALREQKTIAAPVTPEKLRDLLADASRTPRARMERSGLVSNPTGQLLLHRLDRQLLTLAAWLKSAFEAIPFDPIAEELNLRSGDSATINALAIEPFVPGWTFFLHGQIDRIDKRRGLEEYAVVDYKLKYKKFDFWKWAGMENLQLPLYLLALLRSGKDRRVAGGLYLEVVMAGAEADEPPSRRYCGIYRSSTLRSIFPEPKWRALDFIQGSNGDPDEAPRNWGTAISDKEFDTLLARTEKYIGEIGRGIVSGNTAVTPSRHGTMSACTYCTYKPVCGIDFRINRAIVKGFPTRAEVLQSLRDDA